MTARRTRSARIVEAARGMTGVPFRLQGRERASGVDCIGLVTVVLGSAGCVLPEIPARYSIRGGTLARFDAVVKLAGLRPVRRERPGDLVLVQAGVAQFHLMIAVPGGHVHAHAGLGRVVEMPGASPWPVLRRWRWGR